MADITYCACSCANCSGCTGNEPEPTAIERAAALAALVRLREKLLTPSADVPACRDEDPAQPATLAACYPDPPEYQHPEESPDAER